MVDTVYQGLEIARKNDGHAESPNHIRADFGKYRQAFLYFVMVVSK